MDRKQLVTGGALVAAILVGIGLNSNMSGQSTGTYIDEDGDGYSSDVDCNDDPTDPLASSIHPDAVEQWGDEIDQNCNGNNDDLWDEDGDGFLDSTLNPVPNDGSITTYMVHEGKTYWYNDCDDSDPYTHPGAAETQDPYVVGANKTTMKCRTDADEDGYGDANPVEGVTKGNDCDDADPLKNRGFLDMPFNGVNDNCKNGKDESIAKDIPDDQLFQLYTENRFSGQYCVLESDNDFTDISFNSDDHLIISTSWRCIDPSTDAVAELGTGLQLFRVPDTDYITAVVEGKVIDTRGTTSETRSCLLSAGTIEWDDNGEITDLNDEGSLKLDCRDEAYPWRTFIDQSGRLALLPGNVTSGNVELHPDIKYIGIGPTVEEDGTYNGLADNDTPYLTQLFAGEVQVGAIEIQTYDDLEALAASLGGVLTLTGDALDDGDCGMFGEEGDWTSRNEVGTSMMICRDGDVIRSAAMVFEVSQTDTAVEAAMAVVSATIDLGDAGTIDVSVTSASGCIGFKDGEETGGEVCAGFGVSLIEVSYTLEGEAGSLSVGFGIGIGAAADAGYTDGVASVTFDIKLVTIGLELDVDNIYGGLSSMDELWTESLIGLFLGQSTAW